jgi:hypothetical protein
MVVDLSSVTTARLQVYADMRGISVEDAVSMAVLAWTLAEEGHAAQRERCAVEVLWNHDRRSRLLDRLDVDSGVTRDGHQYAGDQ